MSTVTSSQQPVAGGAPQIFHWDWVEPTKHIRSILLDRLPNQLAQFYENGGGQLVIRPHNLSFNQR